MRGVGCSVPVISWLQMRCPAPQTDVVCVWCSGEGVGDMFGVVGRGWWCVWCSGEGGGGVCGVVGRGWVVCVV